MRIAVWHNLPSGGGKRALYDTSLALKARGHEIEFFSPPSADLDFLPLSTFGPEHIVPLGSGTQSRFRKLRDTLRGCRADIAAMDEHCRRSADAINAGGFDLLVAHPCVLFRVTAIGRMVTIPSLVYVQEPQRYLYEALPTPPWMARPARSLGSPSAAVSLIKDMLATQSQRVLVREEVQNAASFDRVLVNSRFSRESVQRAYGIEAKVSYLGVDTQKFSPMGMARERFVIGLGSFNYIKGVDTAVAAIGKMPSPRPRLVWVANSGDAVYQSLVMKQAHEAGVKIEVRKRITDDELVQLLNRAGAMIYPSRLEPFGYSPLEGGATGLPVVGVAEGGIRETVIDSATGLLVDREPEELAEALCRVLDDPAEARRLGENAIDNVRSHWTTEQAGLRIENHLTSVVRQS